MADTWQKDIMKLKIAGLTELEKNALIALLSLNITNADKDDVNSLMSIVHSKIKLTVEQSKAFRSIIQRAVSAGVTYGGGRKKRKYRKKTKKRRKKRRKRRRKTRRKTRRKK